MKILCIGHAAYDITIPLDEYPTENTKNRVKEMVQCGGGPACNGAYLLGKWGMDVAFAGVVGDDTYGRTIKQELESQNVNTKYMELSKEYKTTSSFILANKSNGSRTILTYRPNEMRLKDLTLEFQPDILLFDGQEPAVTKKILEKYPNVISVIDAGRPEPEIIELAKMSTYVVSSKEFAESVTGIELDYKNTESLNQLFQKMKGLFPGEIVVTLESKGCLYEHQGKILMMPSLTVKAQDSTGAGDIFHGAFTYGIANGFNYEDVIRISNIAGAISVTKIGGRNSVPSKEEMKEVFHEFR